MSRPTITLERLQELLPILNVSELCRRSDLPRHRLDNVRRGLGHITADELKRIAKVIAELDITPDHPIRRE